MIALHYDTASVASLRLCANHKDLRKGSKAHADILKRGALDSSPCVVSALAVMYAKCGAFPEAQKVLDDLQVQDAFPWSVLLMEYAKHRYGSEALHCFESMENKGLSVSPLAFSCALQACGSVGALSSGQKMHAQIFKQRLLQNDIVLGTALMDMYVKCGALARAQKVLDELPVHDVVTWSVLITGHTRHGRAEEALISFAHMQHEGIRPNAVTFASILKACGDTRAADKGEIVHAKIVEHGWLEKDVVLGNALLGMYVKCGAFDKAEQVLHDLPVPDVVSWSTLIGGFAQDGRSEEALDCFSQMMLKGFSPNSVTFICVLKACGDLGWVDKGETIHSEAVKQELLQKDLMVGNALVDMYAKCGVISKAKLVFDELRVRNLVSWNVLIAGYAQHGPGEEALNSLSHMHCEGVPPDAITFTSILQACGNIGVADESEAIHNEIIDLRLLDDNSVLGCALLHAYAKCGALVRAQELFDELFIQNVVPWNVLITGYAQYGHAEKALSCFHRMQQEGFIPDATTFASVLNACSHSGLLDEGHKHFRNMGPKCGITPGLQHFTCMVNLLGRTGYLEMVIALIKQMSWWDCLMWVSILGACWKWENVNLGRLAFEHAVQLDKMQVAAYACMRNIVAATGLQGDVEIDE